jgi:hypothetical protein
VGETQVALNVWGVLHLTGYPLYTMSGNLFTVLIGLFGVSGAGAASLHATLWTMIALGGFYALIVQVTRRHVLAGASIFLLALTRSIWIHSVVAEIYSMSLAILVGLWLLGLLPFADFRSRFWLIALLAGIGVAHHRSLAFAAPGLFFALWPELRANVRRLPVMIAGGVPLFLAGFLPYAYIPLRARADAAWLYADDLDTWGGFWFHFQGREADYLIQWPDGIGGWIDNLESSVTILSRELTTPGLAIGIMALIAALWLSPHRRAAWTLALSGLGYFAFALTFHTAVLPEAILMMSLPALVFGVALGVDLLWRRRDQVGWLAASLLIVWGIVLISQQRDFILGLTEDETGLAAIASASEVPRDDDAIFMLSWGPRYFAASYSRLVTDENADLRMADHTADFTALAQDGATFYTQPDTLYGYPQNWWAERIGDVYLTSAGQNLVKLATEPDIIDSPDTDEFIAPLDEGIWLVDAQITCRESDIAVVLQWLAVATPTRNLSVKVHLTAADDEARLEGVDSLAPVYGWRPTSSWLPGEVITEHYRLPRLPGGERIIVGLYDESFQSFGDVALPLLNCDF